MSSMFIDEQPVEVCVDAPETPEHQKNKIFVRPKMDFGTKTKVQSAGARTTLGVVQASHGDVALDFGAYQRALFVHNVVAWSGPAFDGRPCNEANKLRLNPENPLFRAVMAEIARRNPNEDSESAEKNALNSTKPGGLSLLVNGTNG